MRGFAGLGRLATDDRGGWYRGLMEGRGGGGRWRAQYRFAPALHPEARELRLEATDCQWRAFDLAERGRRVVGHSPGPWRFVVALPSA